MKITRTGFSPGTLLTLVIVASAGFGAQARAATIVLGAAGSFGALAKTTVTNTGASIISGDVGVSPAASITGFPPGVVAGGGAIHMNDSLAITAVADAGTAYNALFGIVPPPANDLTGQNLGGKTLLPGVYSFTSAAQLSGILTLDGNGELNPFFAFQVADALTLDAGSSIVGTNGFVSGNLFFGTGTAVTIGGGANLAGTFLAGTGISLNGGASVNGRLLAKTAVTFINNVVTVPPPLIAVPEPARGVLLLSSGGLLLIRRRRSLKKCLVSL